jgi:hypothetical protein
MDKESWTTNWTTNWTDEINDRKPSSDQRGTRKEIEDQDVQGVSKKKS